MKKTEQEDYMIKVVTKKVKTSVPKIETVTVYLASDGKEFKSFEMCCKYEFNELGAKNIEHIQTKDIKTLDDDFAIAYLIDSEQKYKDLKRYLTSKYMEFQYYLPSYSTDWFIVQTEDGDYRPGTHVNSIYTLEDQTNTYERFLNQFK